MAIVKSVRSVGKRLGRVLDAEDRKVLGQAVVLLGGGGVVVVWIAAVAAVAVRIYGVIGG